MLKKTLIAAALAVAGMGASVQASSVASGPVINPANGHGYLLLTPDTWANSEAFAQSLGGHLATVNDADENAWIQANVLAPGNAFAWIGYNDAANDGSFVWASGEASAYTNWISAPSVQPDNLSGFNGQPQSYVIMSPASGQWDDINDGDALVPAYNGVYAVAEVAVPEPASLSLLGLGAAALLAARRRA